MSLLRAAGDDSRLRILKLVAERARGYYVLYSLDEAAIARLSGELRTFLAG